MSDNATERAQGVENSEQVETSTHVLQDASTREKTALQAIPSYVYYELLSGLDETGYQDGHTTAWKVARAWLLDHKPAAQVDK